MILDTVVFFFHEVLKFDNCIKRDALENQQHIKNTNLLDPPLSERLRFRALASSREAGDEERGRARDSSALTSKQRLDRDDA